MDWVYLTNEATGGTTRVAAEPGVVEWHEAHGWARADEPEEKPFVPPKDAPPPGEDGWVDLVHPGFDGRQRIPNDPAAIAGAIEVGWEYPKPPAPENKPAKKAAAKKAAESANDTDEE